MQKTRWSTAVATAALLALPVAAFAQSTQSAPPQNPPATTTSQQPPAAQADATAAKTHLSQARDTLSALTSMPEAAKLQGDARTKVGELISNFNALITAQADWRSAYGKLDANLTSLLGPVAPADQPVGTSGSAALDPAIRAKLVEFRTHLKAFESAAGGAPASADAEPPAAPAASTTSAPPSSPPAAPPSSPPAAPPSNPPAAPPSNPPSDSVSSSASTTANANADAQKELDAIVAIVDKSKTGALTKAETAELRKHVEILRALLIKPGL